MLGTYLKAASATGGIRLVAFEAPDSFEESLQMPPAAKVGDLAVWFDASYTSGTPAAVTPSGFTLVRNLAIDNSGTTDPRLIFAYKILASGDLNSTVSGMTTGTGRKTLMIFRGRLPFASVVTISGDDYFNSASSASLFSTNRVVPYIAFGCFWSRDLSDNTYSFNRTLTKSIKTLYTDTSFKVYQFSDTPESFVLEVSIRSVRNGYFVNGFALSY
jgi:hypothetical protein